jgi:hypothetical protein
MTTRLVLICGAGILHDGEAASERASVSAAAAAGLARLNAARAVTVLVDDEPSRDAGLRARQHERLRDGLARHGASLDDIVDDPAGAAATPDRLADAFRALLRRFNATPAQSLVLAESLAALEAAARLGCRRILLRTGKGRAAQAQGVPDHVLPVAVQPCLAAAAEALLQGER